MEKEQKPWLSDEWRWDIGSAIENAMKFHIEIGEHGCHTLVFTAKDDDFRSIYAVIADAAVDYVLENPHLYGLQKKPIADVMFGKPSEVFRAELQALSDKRKE